MYTNVQISKLHIDRQFKIYEVLKTQVKKDRLKLLIAHTDHWIGFTMWKKHCGSLTIDYIQNKCIDCIY